MLHHGRPGIARSFLRRLSPRARPGTARLGNVGLERGFSVLGQKEQSFHAWYARSVVWEVARAWQLLGNRRTHLLLSAKSRYASPTKKGSASVSGAADRVSRVCDVSLL